MISLSHLTLTWTFSILGPRVFVCVTVTPDYISAPLKRHCCIKCLLLFQLSKLPLTLSEARLIMLMSPDC